MMTDEGRGRVNTHEYVSFGCHACTKQILLWQPGRKGLCPLVDLRKEDYGIHKGHVKLQVILVLACYNYGAACTTIIYQSLVIYVLLLPASWFFFCQAMAMYHSNAPSSTGVGSQGNREV